MSRPGRPVTVQYFKYPETLHWRHEMQWLGEDDHGVWLGAAAGSTVQRGHEPAIAWERPFVQLIPPDAWFTVLGNDRSSKNEIYVDVVTNTQWVSDDRVEMIDVDLDVIRLWDGTVKLLDEDEFIEHQAQLDYPDWLIAGARTAAAEVVLAAEQHLEPFGSRAQHWLDVLAGT